jgi:hypothetical protein
MTRSKRSITNLPTGQEPATRPASPGWITGADISDVSEVRGARDPSPRGRSPARSAGHLEAGRRAGDPEPARSGTFVAELPARRAVGRPGRGPGVTAPAERAIAGALRGQRRQTRP